MAEQDILNISIGVRFSEGALLHRLNQWFAHVATAAGIATGHPLAFILSCVGVVVWAISGPLFGFSDTWQLVINTGTTVITFLLVFVVQNSQNRNAAALHVKIDELMRAMPEARTELATARLEDASAEEIGEAQHETDRLADQDNRQ